MSKSKPIITAVVCTLNRLDDLKSCLEALERERLNSVGLLEVMVVDNGSEDGSVEYLQQWASNGRYLVHEAHQNLCSARNKALEVLQTKWIAYLDDDAIVHEGWFSAFQAALVEYPEMVGGGGRIQLRWPKKQPDWVSDQDLPFFSMLELGNKNKLMDYDEIPVGANMFFQAEMVREIGGFREEFGRSGLSLISGDESDVVRKLQAKGHVFHYLAEMSIDHVVSKERAQMSWLKRRKIAAGISEIRMDLQFQKIPKKSLRRLIFEAKRWILTGLGGDKGQAWVFRGRTTEYLKSWK